VRHEEHRDAEVLLDRPAQAVRVEALGPLHVPDAQEERADVRVHAVSPLLCVSSLFVHPSALRGALAHVALTAVASSL
jgi:hypothetical protein